MSSGDALVQHVTRPSRYIAAGLLLACMLAGCGRPPMPEQPQRPDVPPRPQLELGNFYTAQLELRERPETPPPGEM